MHLASNGGQANGRGVSPVNDAARRRDLFARSGRRIDAEAARAIGSSRLGSLPPGSLDGLLVDVNDVVLPAGSAVHPAGSRPFVDLVVRGVVRVVAESPDGRQATIRYVRSGEIMGVASLFTDEAHVVGAVVLQDARVLMLRPGVVRRMALTDSSVAEVLLNELARRVFQYHAELTGNSFASLREKVARHLLDIATPESASGALVARVSQSELASAVGTSREVVVRLLRDLRRERLIATGRTAITVLSPERLRAESEPMPH